MNHKKWLTFWVFSIVSIVIQAQDCPLSFRSPVNYETVLSGSFGEPRSAHFHSGIDFKQKKGMPHDSIFAIEDGHISRISVQPDGYGNALYIDHACNKTSVYAHLLEFAPRIKSIAQDSMISKRSYSLNMSLPPFLNVTKGEFIGILGSTGRSSGPHLHFEIRNTNSEMPINPAIHGIKPKDSHAPVIKGIMLYELSPDNEELDIEYFEAIEGSTTNFKLRHDTLLTDALKVGIGIRSYDTMNGASNHNGIYSLELRVDDKPTFGFSLDSIDFSLTKFIHAHMDYPSKLERKYVTKCFVNPGNLLDIYQSEEQKGFIFPFEFRYSKIGVIVRDIEGNQSTIEFFLKRSENILKERDSKFGGLRIKPRDSVHLNLGLTSLEFRPGTFDRPIRLSIPEFTGDSILLKQDVPIALFRDFKVLRVIKDAIFQRSQYVFAAYNEKGETVRFPTSWENDTLVVTHTNELQNFGVTIDSIPPKIEMISLPGKNRRECAFVVNDNLLPVNRTDYVQFEVTLDDQWVLCNHDIKSNKVWFHLREPPSNKKYHLKVYAIDASGNESTIEREFIY